jgi:hypothetical protein
MRQFNIFSSSMQFQSVFSSDADANFDSKSLSNEKKKKKKGFHRELLALIIMSSCPYEHSGRAFVFNLFA